MMTVSIDESGHSNFGIIRDRTMGNPRTKTRCSLRGIAIP
jgi:hypothetical protein